MSNKIHNNLYKVESIEVFHLDMWRNEQNDWTENDRFLLATISINGWINKRKLMKLIREDRRTNPYLHNLPPQSIYIEDLYGTGTWYEIGARKQHEPYVGIKVNYFV